MRVRHDDAGVDRESFASDDPFLDAARDHGLEELAQEIALAKPAVAVLGKGRMIRNVAVEPQPTEPAVGQIEVDLVAQPPLGTNAEAVAIYQHPHHQLRIDRRPTRLAVIRLQMPPDPRKVHKPVDLAQQVIVRDMALKAEAVEQRLLHHPPLAHHRPNLPLLSRTESAAGAAIKRVFQRNTSTPAVSFAQIAAVHRRHRRRAKSDCPLRCRELGDSRGFGADRDGGEFDDDVVRIVLGTASHL